MYYTITLLVVNAVKIIAGKERTLAIAKRNTEKSKACRFFGFFFTAVVYVISCWFSSLLRFFSGYSGFPLS